MNFDDLERLLALAGVASASVTPLGGATPSVHLTSKRAPRTLNESSLLKELNDHVATSKAPIKEVSPPGFKGTVKAMKKHKDIDNPYALAWYEKKKGDKSHYKADGTKKEAVGEAVVNEIMGDDYYPPFRPKRPPPGQMPPEQSVLDAQRAAAQERVRAKRGAGVPAFGEGPMDEAQLAEKSPAGWKGTTKAMKKHKDVKNPHALAHWQKKKGHKSHKPDHD